MAMTLRMVEMTMTTKIEDDADDVNHEVKFDESQHENGKELGMIRAWVQVTAGFFDSQGSMS